MSNAVQDFLNQGSGSSYPSVSFPEIGAEVKGRIVSEPRIVPTTPYGGGEPEDKLVVEIETTVDTNTPDGNGGYNTVKGETVALWVRKGWMLGAVREAVREAGRTTLDEGGTLHVRYTEDGERKPGKNPPKLFKAKYTPPAAGGVDLDDLA